MDVNCELKFDRKIAKGKKRIAPYVYKVDPSLAPYQ
jgi:hypothetical protein